MAPESGPDSAPAPGNAGSLRHRALRLGLVPILLGGFVWGLPFVLQDFLTYFPRRYPGKPPESTHPALPYFPYTTSDGREQWGCRVDPAPDSPEPSEGFPRNYLVFYGNGSLAIEMAAVLQPIANRTGCTFHIVDYRGYGFNEGRPSEEGLTADAVGAYDTLAQEGTFEGGVGILGHSMGSAVSMALALKRPVDRLILISPFTSIRDMARETFPPPLSLVARNDWPNRERLKTLLGQPADQRPNSVTLIHGASDEIVPSTMSRQLADDSGEQVQLIVKDGAGHNDIIEMTESILIDLLLGHPVSRADP